MKRKLESCRGRGALAAPPYTQLADVERDMALILSNCHTYNTVGAGVCVVICNACAGGLPPWGHWVAVPGQSHAQRFVRGE
jgi:hypothetical protein